MARQRFKIVQSSTWEFIREARQTSEYHLFDFLHGYIYARWPYLYISIGKGEHPLSPLLARLAGLVNRLILPFQEQKASKEHSPKETVADTYHGKVVPLKEATELVTIREEIQLKNLEKIIPYSKARDIVLKNPDYIVALDCPCRSAKENPCQPLDVCLIVGEPFASFVAEHHPQRSRRIDSDEAVDILHAEEERGHVHHAFFKDAMFGRFYAICNCCACCCGAMGAHHRGTPMLASSGFISRVNEDLCIGCGECNDYCQFFALSLNDFHAVVDVASCMGCGSCVSHCSQEALSLVRDPSKGEPLEISRLMESMIES